MPHPHILITATDDSYAPLALDLLRSLRAAKTAVHFDIGVLDLGLSKDSKQKLNAYGVTIKPANIDFDYPGRVLWEQQAPYFRCLTARPFLRDYFPGYQSYMWMDADAWVQTPDALNVMLAVSAATDEALIAAELDRDYPTLFKSAHLWQLHANWYRGHFPKDIADAMLFRPMLNCGVFALSATSPVWTKWADLYARTLAAIPVLGHEHFMVDQLAMNIVLYLGVPSFKVMPAEFNWLTMYCMPLLDEVAGVYVRPTEPRAHLSVIHIAGKHKLQATNVMTTTGKILKRQLTYSGLMPEADGEVVNTAPSFQGDRL